MAYYGGGNRASFWSKSYTGEIKCEPVSWITKYSIYDKDDYKRCICDGFGAGEADCP